MADSKRQKIVDAVEARFKTILVSNGYETDVGRSVFEWRSRPFDKSELPALNFEDREEVQTFSHGKQSRSLNINVDLIVSGSTAPADLRKLIADVTKAIGTDLTWGKLAKDTIPGSEDIGVEQEENRIAGASLSFTIKYRTEIFNPYN